MKKLFLISIGILITSLLFAQQKNDSKKILIIPLNKNMIKYSGKAKRNVKFNNIEWEKFVNEAKTIINEQILSELKNYKVDILCDEFNSICDSLNQFKISKNFDSVGLPDNKPRVLNVNININPNNYKYQNRIINDYEKDLITAVIEKSNYDYVLVFNSFEIISSMFLREGSYLSLHCEIYDEEFNKIYGGKNLFFRKINKKMYYYVLTRFIKKAVSHEFLTIKKVIN